MNEDYITICGAYGVVSNERDFELGIYNCFGIDDNEPFVTLTFCPPENGVVELNKFEWLIMWFMGSRINDPRITRNAGDTQTSWANEQLTCWNW